MERTDMTKWLIHFTKDVTDENQPIIEYEKRLDDGSVYQELDYTNQLPYGYSKMSAFECLKNIIKECGIRYGYSFRKGKTTLFGGEPVICLTEMPLISLVNYTRKRRSNSVTTYGIAIKKNEAYKFGARPAIYGLSDTQKLKYVENNNIKRILDSKHLPLKEQYRLVSFDLGERKIDWTHEREWRIKRKDDILHNTIVEYGYEIQEVEIFNIFDRDYNNEEVILIVNSEDEANELFDLVQHQLDSESNPFGKPFTQKKISILNIGKLSNKDFSRIEDLDREAYFEIKLEELDEENLNRLSEIIRIAKEEITPNAEKEFMANRNGNYDVRDACGFASIKSYNPRNKYLRGLKKLGFASSFGDGYSIKAIGKYTFIQSITYHEFIAEKVCDFLNKEIGDIFHVTSRMD